MISPLLPTYAALFSFILKIAAAQTVQDTGFQENDGNMGPEQESWLQRNDRYIFIIVVGLVIFGLLIWYIVASIRGMRKRLARENEKQMYIIQQASGAPNHVIPEPGYYYKYDNTAYHRY